jgi:GMP synthase (glutamine-hydrolysing)
MKPVLILQHTPTETSGVLETHLAAAGVPWQYVELFRGTPERLEFRRFAGLIVLGGSMNAGEVEKYPFLASEPDWIREALDAEIPLLGICLGAQLLAKALGSPVYANPVREIGWHEIELTPAAADDPLLSACGPRQTVFQWHGDTFDLPAGAVHLAHSAVCRNQAFRYGPRAWGLQFHVEIGGELVNDWLEELERQGDARIRQFVDPEAIRVRTPELLSRVDAAGELILPRFAAICAR